MRTVYLDSEYRCHVDNDGTMTAVETDCFDGKCGTYIEGCRFIPAGERWTRPDGVVFEGEMKAPWKNSAELEAAQAQYERDNSALQAAYQEGVNSAYG